MPSVNVVKKYKVMSRYRTNPAKVQTGRVTTGRESGAWLGKGLEEQQGKAVRGAYLGLPLSELLGDTRCHSPSVAEDTDLGLLLSSPSGRSWAT